MTDDALNRLWTTLEPAAEQRERIAHQVEAWLDARDTSLAAEWAALVAARPLPALGLAVVSAAAIVLTTPLLWVARALL
jgi:hypothetical protein